MYDWLHHLRWVVPVLLCTAASGAGGEPKARTDMHGDPLPPGALLRLGTSRFRHGGSIYSLACSKDGRLLVTGNAGYKHLEQDASVVVWDLASGRRVRTFPGQAHVVRSVALAPDGKQLAVVNGYGKVLLYDLATNKELRQLETESPEHVLFTPDGSTLLVSDIATVRRWDRSTLKELEPLRGHRQRIMGLAVAANGKRIATCATDGTVRLRDAAGDGRHLWELSKYGIGVALSPDGTRLACGTSGSELLVWDTDSGRELWRVKTDAWRVSAQSFAPDGKSLITGDAKLVWWDAATGKAVRMIDGHYGLFQHVAYSPDGKRIVTGGDEAAPRFWDPDSGKEIDSYPGHRHLVLAGAFTPDGRALVTASDERFVRLWDLATAQARPIGTSEQSIHAIAVAPDGRALATSGSWSLPSLWELPGGKRLRTFTSKDQDIPGGPLFFSADGKTLAAAHGNCGVHFWEAASGRELPIKYVGSLQPTSSIGNQYPHFVLAPDGRSLATTRSQFNESGVIVWDAATGKERVTLAARGEPAGFSSDGRLVAVFYGAEVRLVDAATGVTVRRVKGDGAEVRCAAFAPDGKTLATAGNDRTVYLWETLTGEPRDQFAGHGGFVRFVAFAPDGRRLASGGGDHTALIWDLTGGAAKMPLTAKQREALWQQLAGSNAAEAYRAIWALSADAESVAFLQERLRPTAPADPKRVARLIADLDSDDFAERQQAAQELAKLHELAAPALRRALDGKGTLELRRRVEQLLDASMKEVPPEQLGPLRAVEVLEHAGTAEARRLLQVLAKGAPEARLTQEAKAALAR
jgi:WD40 repeat protein